MSDVYILNSKAKSPLDKAAAKTYLKVTSPSDDKIIQSLIDSCTRWGENYTGRDFRAITWTLKIDEFPARIVLNRDPVATITSVKHLVSDALTTVASSVYYLKKLTQCSEILLNDGQSWPTNTDDREQAIEVEFVTSGYTDQDLIVDAIKRHVAFMYENRGDCDVRDGASQSGVNFIYDQFRIARI